MEKSYKKSIIGTSISLCSLFLVFILVWTSYAWLASNKTTKASNIGVMVDANADLGIYNTAIYKRIGADNAIDVSDQGAVELTEYDSIFTDRNVNTSIIIRLELVDLPYENGQYQPFYLRVRCRAADTYLQSLPTYSYEQKQALEDDWVEDGASLPDTYWKEDGKPKTILSNIIGIRCALGSETLNNYTEANDIYTEGKSYLKTECPNQKTFISTSNCSIKQGVITFEFDNYASKVEEGKVVVYIEVDYSDALIENYSTEHDIITQSGDQTEGGSESIQFTSDLTNCFIFLGGE